jgi:hypothetical protein
VAAHKIRVQVRLDYVFDLESLRLRFIYILIDVALRVYDCRFAFRADEV